MIRLPLFLFASLATVVVYADDWNRFRGPNGSGLSSDSGVPSEWSPETNMKWSAELPGKGSSSPIVIGDRVYVTSYTGYGLDKENPGNPADLERHLIAIDRNTGQEVWRSSVKSEGDEDPYEGFIQEHGYASSTPVSNGERLFVQFGKTGMVAFDMDGNRLWTTNLGDKSDPAKWGDGSGAALYEDLIIANAGIVGHQIVALNQSDGSVAWKIENPDFTNCWSTPILVTVDGRDEMVFSMPGKIMGVDPGTGKELWFAESPIAQTVCGSLGERNGVVFAMGGRRGNAVAVRCGGSGDVTDTHTVWKQPLRAGIGTPIVVGDNMYWSTRGIAYAANCETGELVFEERLPAASGGNSRQRMPAGDYASPIAIGERLYLLTRGGTMFVMDAGNQFELAAQNGFGDDNTLFNATPAVSDGDLFVRSEGKLYCIGNARPDN